MFQNMMQTNGWPGYSSYASLFPFIPLIAIFAVLDIILRGYSLWFSARRGQNVWFICLLVFNTLGILPLVYLILNRPTKKKRSK